ncbi:MAG: peptide chain release factor N(5)-glutamine methyltransferase [Rickettsiales bacterium]
MSIAQHLYSARQALAPIAGPNAALEARLLAAHAWGMSPEDLLREANVTRDAQALHTLLARRSAAEPVAHILGYKEFWRDRFAVSRDVLTPRADSETLIETLLRLYPQQNVPLRILDLGTGSGCLLLSGLREYPNATGVGADQSEAALAMAAQNAAQLMLQERASFVRSEWCSNLGESRFHVVLANPPYIPSGEIAGLDADVRGFEPHAALDGGADGLDCYRSIVQQLPPHLLPGAHVLFEVGAGQAHDVAALAIPYFSLHSIVPDLAGIARVVALTFTPDA